MTAEEWDAVSGVLENAWPGEFSDDQEAAYSVLLSDYERVAVEAALKMLARAGSRFRPSAGEIAGAIERWSAPPTFDELWPAVSRALRHRPDDERVLDEVRSVSGEHAAGWLALYGVARLSREPIFDPDVGGAILHRLREHYAQLTAEEPGRLRLVSASRGELPAPAHAGLRQIPGQTFAGLLEAGAPDDAVAQAESVG